MEKIRNKKIIIGALSVIAVVIVVIVGILLFQKSALEKRLKSKTWWEEIEITNTPHGDRYDVSMSCKRYTFCKSGNIREEDFGFGDGVYWSNKEVTLDNIPEHYTFSDVRSSNDENWKISLNKKLKFEGKSYRWNKEEAEDTWYIKGDTLRIGKIICSIEKPSLDIYPFGEEIPYWCAKCGKKGPYENECPNCKSKDKIECDWESPYK